MQVSETWTTEFAEDMDVKEFEASLPETTSPESRTKIAALLAAGGLEKVSRLDTCVTVVDSTTVRSVSPTYAFVGEVPN